MIDIVASLIAANGGAIAAVSPPLPGKRLSDVMPPNHGRDAATAPKSARPKP